MGWGCTGH